MKIANILISISMIGLPDAALATGGMKLAERLPSADGPATALGAGELDADWQLLVNGYFAIQQGYRMTPTYTFGNGGVTALQLRGTLGVQSGEFCGASLYSVDIKHTPGQTMLTRYLFDANGMVTLPEGRQTILAAVILFHQPYYAGGRCLVSLSAKTAGGGGGGEQPGEYQYAGVLHYEGGFRNRLEAEIAGAPRISRFWLRIPQYCAGLEVLEAGSVTEGVYAAARLVDAVQQIYEVAGGDAPASSIAASLNGPISSSCDIPVFVQTSVE